MLSTRNVARGHVVTYISYLYLIPDVSPQSPLQRLSCHVSSLNKFVESKRLQGCQLSRISRESPAYTLFLPLSC